MAEGVNDETETQTNAGSYKVHLPGKCGEKYVLFAARQVDP